MPVACACFEALAAFTGQVRITDAGRLDESRKSLCHEMAVSFFPNWIGQRQLCIARIEGDVLQLSTDVAQHINGALKTVTLTWKRADPN